MPAAEFGNNFFSMQKGTCFKVFAIVMMAVQVWKEGQLQRLKSAKKGIGFHKENPVTLLVLLEQVR